MKVTQILYSGLGGHGSVAFSLLDADNNQEWQPLMGFLGIEPLLPAYAESCQKRGVEYEYFPAISGKPWHMWPRISKWLTQTRPDAIVLHGVTALLPCLWHSQRNNVPLVVVEHQANSLKRRSEWIFSHLAMIFADQVVVLTPAYQQELEQRLGMFYREGKVKVIPNGIDATRFTPVNRSAPAHRLVRLGMASRFTGIKRHDVLVEMIVELRRCKPEINWQLSLAGAGESWNSICEMVRIKELDDCIHFPGQLDESELVEWYQNLDIYLHASDGETLSTALLQAMASQLPIVASDVPGIKSLVGDKMICGILIKEQSVHDFALAVIGLNENHQQALELAQVGRQLVVSSYSQNKMFGDYHKVLKSFWCRVT